MAPRRTLSITTAAVLAVLIAGCGTETSGAPGPAAAPSAAHTPVRPSAVPGPAGIAGLSAQQILTKATTAAKAVVSVRIRGSLGAGTSLDVSLTRTAGFGTVTTDGAPVQIVVIGRTAYVRPSEAFWHQSIKSKSDAGLVIRRVRGRWIKVALTDKGLGQVASFASKRDFFDTTFDQAGPVRTAGTQTIAGILCVGLRDASLGTTWLDAGNARLIRMDPPGVSGSITFSEYGQVKAPKAPPKSQVVDAKTLGM